MMKSMNSATTQSHALRVGSVLVMAGVLMTGTLMVSSSSWADGGSQDSTKSRARVITKNQKRAEVANEKSSSAALHSGSASDAFDRASEAASRVESTMTGKEKGKLAELIRRVIRARDVAEEAKTKAESASAEAAKYAAEADDLATRQAAGEDIKSSDIRRAKRKAEKAEQRAKAQMKLAQVKADVATRLADKHAEMVGSKVASGSGQGITRSTKKVFVAGGTAGTENGVNGDAVANAIAEYGFDPTIANSGTWGEYDKYSGNVDEMGWTILPVAADAKLIYVSSSEGDDGNDGLSPEKPKKTIAAGKGLLRPGFPDRLLMKRGDVFYEAIGTLSNRWDTPNPGTLRGRSADEPMIFGAYGDGDRPLLKIGSEIGIRPWNGDYDASSYIAIVDLYFYAQTRDPNSPEFTGTAGGSGYYGYSVGEDILIENCRFDYCGVTQIASKQNGDNRFSNFKIRRSVVFGSYSGGGHAQGLYADATDGILIEECIFDHNGWNELVGDIGRRTKFNHNIYISGDNTGLIARGNLITRGSSAGLQARPGGIVENNLFVGNSTQLNFGWVRGSYFPPDGVTGQVEGNVIMDGVPDAETGALYGIGIENIREVLVKNNIVVRTGPIKISGSEEEGRVGINNLTFAGNQISNSPDYGINLYYVEFKDTLIQHNLLGGGKGDIFDRDGAEQKIKIANNEEGVQPLLEDVGFYYSQFGGEDSLDAYLQDARDQSRQNWRWLYVGDYASNYLRNHTVPAPK